MVKKEVRVVGIDDAPFDKFKETETFIIGVFYRGGNFMDGVLSAKVQIDGTDSTQAVSKMVRGSKFYPQLQCIMLDGIAVGGFNIIDVRELSSETKLPVIVVVRDYPDFERILSVLKKLGMESKIALIENAGKPIRLGKIYAQLINISEDKAREIIRITASHSFIPEPIRVAHLVASGIYFGESRGKV